MDIKKLITDQFEEMVAFRRDLHEHAESSGNEVRTAARISEELTKSGIEHIVTPYHAVIATIHGGRGPGKTVALRGDIDALAMPEETGLPFACKTRQAMHACGHDGHAAQLLAASCCSSPRKRAAGAPHRLWPTGFLTMWTVYSANTSATISQSGRQT